MPNKKSTGPERGRIEIEGDREGAMADALEEGEPKGRLAENQEREEI